MINWLSSLFGDNKKKDEGIEPYDYHTYSYLTDLDPLDVYDDCNGQDYNYGDDYEFNDQDSNYDADNDSDYDDDGGMYEDNFYDYE